MRSILIALFAFFPLLSAFADTEPNDTWQTANALPQDTTVAGTQAEDDWYMITVVAETRVLIDLAFLQMENPDPDLPPDGNLRLRLYDDSRVNEDLNVPGAARRSSTTSTDHEFIDISGLGAGTYYILVDGDNEGNSYALTWTEITGADDAFEINNDSASATSIAGSVVAFGIQSDLDVYSIDVTTDNERVLASLRFSGGQFAANLDLALRDSSGNVVASSASPDLGTNEVIDFDLTASGAGTYFLEVSAGDDNTDVGDNTGGDGDGYALTWVGVSPTDPISFPTPDETVTPTTTTTTGSSSSGAFSPLWLLALMLAGLLRRKYR